MILTTQKPQEGSETIEGATAPALGGRWRGGLEQVAHKFGVVGVWLLLIVVFSVLRPEYFFTLSNFQTMFASQAIVLILSLGLVVSMTSGDFDFSLAGLMCVDVVIIGQLHIVHGVPYGYSWIIVLVVSALIGAVQAALIVGLELNAFIVTLGSGTGFIGIAKAIQIAPISGVSAQYADLMAGKLLGLQTVFWIGLGAVLFLWYLYGYTPLGRQLFFAGANRDVARLAGISVTKLRVGSLIGGAVLAGVAAIVAVGYLDGSNPDLGTQYTLPMASGALLSMTCIWPGRPNPWGALVAAYFLVTGYTGLQMLGLGGWITQVFYGGALVVAIAVSTLAARRIGGSLPGANV